MKMTYLLLFLVVSSCQTKVEVSDDTLASYCQTIYQKVIADFDISRIDCSQHLLQGKASLEVSPEEVQTRLRPDMKISYFLVNNSQNITIMDVDSLKLFEEDKNLLRSNQAYYEISLPAFSEDYTSCAISINRQAGRYYSSSIVALYLRNGSNWNKSSEIFGGEW